MSWRVGRERRASQRRRPGLHLSMYTTAQTIKEDRCERGSVRAGTSVPFGRTCVHIIISVLPCLPQAGRPRASNRSGGVPV